MTEPENSPLVLFRQSALAHPDRLWALHELAPLVGVIARCWPGETLKESQRKERTLKLIEQAHVYITNSNPRVRAKLEQCTGDSIVQSLADTASLGLSLVKALGETHLVPYGTCCTHMTGYPGFIKLIIQTGMVASVQVDAAYQGEHFAVRGGTNPGIDHDIRTDDGFDRDDLRITHVYMIVNNLQGPPSWCVMNRQQIDKVRAASKASDGPWRYWYGEMAKKSVIRRGRKQIPLRTEDQSGQLLLRAMELDNRDFGILRAEAEKQQNVLWCDYLKRGHAAVDAEIISAHTESLPPPMDEEPTTESQATGGAQPGATAASPEPEQAAAPGTGAPPPPAPAEPAPATKKPTQKALDAFRARVKARRGGNSSLSDAEWIKIVSEAEVGCGLLEMNLKQFQQLGQALQAGKYDWDGGERLPDAGEGENDG